MLPQDSKRHCEEASLQSQSSLDSHLVPKDRVVQYSDSAFREAAIRWLINTDQPIHALQHPDFKMMIDVASRAPTTAGVKIPSHGKTREVIIDLFKASLSDLRTCFQSEVVKGRVNLTCDVWQASNVDAYFAVTGSWVEEKVLSVWTIETALLGFVRLNDSHHGTRLGQALYKVVQRVGLTNKVGYVTSDSATNNDTMMDEFGDHVKSNTGIPYNGRKRRLRCMAHIINLATQAFLAAHSKSVHYDPSNPEANVCVEVQDGIHRDEVGLVRAIAVKERSSAKRKQLFQRIQTRTDDGHVLRTAVLQLILDMKVRWSSTYLMLRRALDLKEEVNYFVQRLGLAERDVDKRRKLLALEPMEMEWGRVQLLLSLLGHAEKAQHSFSMEQGPTLHTALPALEALHKAWSSRCKVEKMETWGIYLSLLQ